LGPCCATSAKGHRRTAMDIDALCHIVYGVATTVKGQAVSCAAVDQPAEIVGRAGRGIVDGD